MAERAGRYLRAGAVAFVCAAALAACGNSSSSPTTSAPAPTTGPAGTGSPTTTYRGAPSPGSGLSAVAASRWACAYLTALAPDTGQGPRPNVEGQAVFDSEQVERYAAVARTKGGRRFSALASDAATLVAYARSRDINWTDPESFWVGVPPNKVSGDCRALVNTAPTVAS